MANEPTILIIDDDAAVRDSLVLLLSLHGYQTQVFASAEEFLDRIGEGVRGCVLLDLRLPGMTGLELQATLATRKFAPPILVLTAHGDIATARHALKAGAFDFIEKPIDPVRLIPAIEAALAVEVTASEVATRRIGFERKLARLTPRERQVLEFVVNGRHNREIAIDLGISARTVEVYKARMMEKLQVERLSDLIRIALDLEFPPGPK
ncbi:MAG TPA: response regulator [Casimicrobiaceae bacterium]|nr:response regulator [Casimicrobiaceae bacterium]